MPHLDFEQLKHEIDLPVYASTLGYQIDRKKSTGSSIVMRLDGDKIVISKKSGAWVYFSVHDDRDNGTVIDFVKNRTGHSLFDIGKDLNAWLGRSSDLSALNHYTGSVAEHKPDPQRMAYLFNRCVPVSQNAYLETRSIGSEILDTQRFKNRVFQDRHDNAVFPHWLMGEICALELRHHTTRVFARGSLKTFWRSNIHPDDTTLIVSESPIDALSYASLHSVHDAFFAATGGGLSPRQIEYLQQAVKSNSALKFIRFITDNDKGGDKLTERLRLAVLDSGYKSRIERHSPTQPGQDWNDVLCLNQAQ